MFVLSPFLSSIDWEKSLARLLVKSRTKIRATDSETLHVHLQSTIADIGSKICNVESCLLLLLLPCCFSKCFQCCSGCCRYCCPGSFQNVLDVALVVADVDARWFPLCPDCRSGCCCVCCRSCCPGVFLNFSHVLVVGLAFASKVHFDCYPAVFLCVALVAALVFAP